MDVLNKILDEFDGALDNIAHHIAPFLNISLSSVSSQLTSIENATLHHSLSVLVLALGSTYLRIGGIDVRNHTEISNEFATLKRLNDRINETRQQIIEKQNKEKLILQQQQNTNDNNNNTKDNSSVSSSSSEDTSNTDSVDEENHRINRKGGIPTSHHHHKNGESKTSSSSSSSSSSFLPTVNLSVKNNTKPQPPQPQVAKPSSSIKSPNEGKGGTKRKYDDTTSSNHGTPTSTSVSASDTIVVPSLLRTTNTTSTATNNRIISSTPQPQLAHLNWRKELEQNSKRKR